ncbi:MAG: nitrogen regulation protein NR(I) [Rhodospirillales bacterium]
MLAGRRIGIVEDDEIMGASLVQRLALEGARPTWWTTGDAAVQALRAGERSFDAVVCDIRMPGRDGETLFNDLAAVAPPPPFLFLTAYGDIDQAVRLLRCGASDYLTKPFDFDTFLERLAAIARSFDDIGSTKALGVSPAMRAIEEMLVRLADHPLPILIRGETGVGKEIAARFLHERSQRAAAPFIAVNCAAIPAELLESELFGHERGAFSAAQNQHAGYVERAAGGTLFLDEIGDMPLAMQAKLLRLIEDGHFHRVGGEEPLAFEARILSASHADLEGAVGEGRLRRDLFYRLNAVEVALPALRERPEDLLWLLQRFFDAAREKAPHAIRGISGQAEEAALSHAWPGNVRELRNRMERAVALAKGDLLARHDLFPEAYAAAGPEAAVAPLAEAREAAERRQIARALAQTGGKVSAAARLLKISRTTLWEKMQRLGF